MYSEVSNMKRINIYYAINILGIIVCIVLAVCLFVLIEHKVFIGVLFRAVFSLLIIYNAICTLVTNKTTFLIKKGQEKYRLLVGILLLLVGVGAFVTVILGYGINGYPLFDWSTIF